MGHPGSCRFAVGEKQTRGLRSWTGNFQCALGAGNHTQTGAKFRQRSDGPVLLFVGQGVDGVFAGRHPGRIEGAEDGAGERDQGSACRSMRR